MASEHRIGTHRYVLDEDTVHNMPDPQVSLDLPTMEAYTALVEPIFQRYGRLFMLVDGRSMFKVDAQARRHLAAWPRGPQIVACAVYGGGAVTRALIKLIVAAMSVFGSLAMENHAYFGSEAEARSWLQEERRKYLNAHPEAPR